MTSSGERTAVPAARSDLSRRAVLTAATGLAQQLARLLTAFIVTPLLVAGLGPQLYGAWMMIQQTVGYFSLSDLRPAGALKLSLAVTQHLDDAAYRQRQMGAALLVSGATLPVLAVLGAAVVWLAPWFIRVDTVHQPALRLALALTLVGVALDRPLSLPANALRGMNLDFKAPWQMTTAAILPPVAGVTALYMGGGLAGVAGATMAGMLAVNALRFHVARTALEWLGVARPTRDELRRFMALSGWLVVSGLSGLLLSAIDYLIAGTLFGPSAASVYAVTAAVPRLASEPLWTVLGAGAAGVAGLSGQDHLRRVHDLRVELHVAALFVLSVVGITTVVLNRSFVELWVGPHLYGGPGLNLAIQLGLIAAFAFRIEAQVLDALLDFRGRSVATLVAGVGGAVLSYVLASQLGLAGIALGTLAAHLGLVKYLSRVIDRRLGESGSVSPGRGRLVSVAIAALGLSALVDRVHPVQARSWGSLFALGAATAIVAGVLLWHAGLSATFRGALSRRAALAVASVRRARVKAVTRPLD